VAKKLEMTGDLQQYDNKPALTGSRSPKPLKKKESDYQHIRKRSTNRVRGTVCMDGRRKIRP
jgi:hypothetical protein